MKSLGAADRWGLTPEPSSRDGCDLWPIRFAARGVVRSRLSFLATGTERATRSSHPPGGWSPGEYGPALRMGGASARSTSHQPLPRSAQGLVWSLGSTSSTPALSPLRQQPSQLTPPGPRPCHGWPLIGRHACRNSLMLHNIRPKAPDLQIDALQKSKFWPLAPAPASHRRRSAANCRNALADRRTVNHRPFLSKQRKMPS
jgi:hypothetical protein